MNGVGTNNLFNGNSTSQVGENRFVLNTGENFGAGGEIQTSTSVYGAIGQALPTPPSEAIQEISVNAAMYDASQGANSRRACQRDHKVRHQYDFTGSFTTGFRTAT